MIASIDGMKSNPWPTYPYQASKAGLIHLTRRMAAELVQHNIIVNGIGTVDSDYHGELMVALLNLSGESQQLRCGERIAQLVFCPISCPTLEEVTDFEQPTERNTGGFGSTGS